MSKVFCANHRCTSVVVVLCCSGRLVAWPRMDHLALGHLTQRNQRLPKTFIGLSMWCDGLMGQEHFVCVLPGLVKEAYKIVRIPFTMIPKHFVNDRTVDFILQLLSWSLLHMFTGTLALEGNDFEEAYGKKLAGKPMGFSALLLEVKGEWEFYSNALHLPLWRTRLACASRAKPQRSTCPRMSWMPVRGRQT